MREGKGSLNIGDTGDFGGYNRRKEMLYSLPETN